MYDSNRLKKSLILQKAGQAFFVNIHAAYPHKASKTSTTSIRSKPGVPRQDYTFGDNDGLCPVALTITLRLLTTRGNGDLQVSTKTRPRPKYL